MTEEQIIDVCPVCKEGRDFTDMGVHKEGNTRFSLHECMICRVQFWSPFFNIGRDWHEENNKDDVSVQQTAPISRGYHKKFLALYEPILQNKKILDLGCGSGELLSELHRRGNEVWGVDFDRNKIEAARHSVGLQHIYAMSFDEFFGLPNLPQFDIICFFEVLQYVDNPVDFFKNVNRLLGPEGFAVASIPSRQRVFVNLSTWDFPPNHITRWNVDAVQEIAKRAGLRVSFHTYVEQFVILAAALNAKFRAGAVKRVLRSQRGTQGVSLPLLFVRKAAAVKELLVGGILGGLVWIEGKITKRPNGIAFIELGKATNI